MSISALRRGCPRRVFFGNRSRLAAGAADRRAALFTKPRSHTVARRASPSSNVATSRSRSFSYPAGRSTR